MGLSPEASRQCQNRMRVQAPRWCPRVGETVSVENTPHVHTFRAPRAQRNGVLTSRGDECLEENKASPAGGKGAHGLGRVVRKLAKANEVQQKFKCENSFLGSHRHQGSAECTPLVQG